MVAELAVLDEAVAGGPAQIEAAGGIRGQRVRGGALEPGDHDVAVRPREADVEPAAHRVIGRERHAQQPLFAAALDHRSDVEEIGALHHTVAHQPDASVLLHDELVRRIRRILDECDR
jgi:hypothetical protein